MAYPTVTIQPKLYPWTSVMASPYLADNTGVVDCAASIEAIKSTQSNIGQIYWPAGTYLLETNLTIPVGMDFDAPNATVSIASGVTLTINSYLISGNFTIADGGFLVINGGADLRNVRFTDASVAYNGVTFGGSNISEVYLECWTLNTTPGTTDMSAALYRAVNSGVSKIKLGPVWYAVNCVFDSINGIEIIGSGYDASNTYTPQFTALVPKVATSPVLKFNTECYDWKFRSLNISSPNQDGKWGVYYVAGGYRFTFYDVAITGFQAAGTGYGVYNETLSWDNHFIGCHIIYNNTGVSFRGLCQGLTFDRTRIYGNLTLQVELAGTTGQINFNLGAIEYASTDTDLVHITNCGPVNFFGVYMETGVSQANLALKLVNSSPVLLSGVYFTGNGQVDYFAEIDATSRVEVHGSVINGVDVHPFNGQPRLVTTTYNNTVTGWINHAFGETLAASIGPVTGEMVLANGASWDPLSRGAVKYFAWWSGAAWKAIDATS